MENPEEVLQALDEFQKMRPSEIPRELEDYLSWVAKTGDPVYQWSLVKPLFREKLTRVMTDFYESCPSLELGPCPNVEQFNYDIMKCNLLELLESFANAPFTVQRICELITSPRKEYNRVDKFMRAIEKNILVVSTIEPGPAARRNENGEGLVNGSLDQESTDDRATREVEMESWAKDRPDENSVPADGQTSLDAVNDELKISRSKEEVSLADEKPPSLASPAEIVVSPPDVASEVARETHDREASRVENLSIDGTVVSSSLPCEIPETVMNEDTSSQPSLDSENEDADIATSEKLQTSFRTKDFAKNEAGRTEKFYGEEITSEAEKRKIEDEDIEAEVTGCSDDTTGRPIGDAKNVCEGAEITMDQAHPEKRARVELSDGETNDQDDDSSSRISSSSLEKSEHSVSSAATRCTDDAAKEKISETLESTCEERLTSDEDTKISEVDEGTRKEEDSPPKVDRPSVVNENSKPIVEEPNFEDETKKEDAETRESGVTIEEAMDDDTRNNKSIVPDPIPIVEEPKDEEPVDRGIETPTEITELTETVKPESVSRESSETIESDILVDESSTMERISEDTTTCVRDTCQDDITDVKCVEETVVDDKIVIEPAESMEIDGEESLAAFQQDEPMEQEPGDTVKS